MRPSLLRRAVAIAAAAASLSATGCEALEELGPSSDVVQVLLQPAGAFNPETRASGAWPELLATDTLVVEAWRCLNRTGRGADHRALGPAGVQPRVIVASNADGSASGGPIFVFPWTSLALTADSLVVPLGDRVRLPYEGRGSDGVTETSGRLLPLIGARSAQGRVHVEQSGAWASRGNSGLVQEFLWVRGLAVGRDMLTIQAAGRTLRLPVVVTP